MFAPQRDEQGERGARALDAAHRDPAVVGRHHVLDDGQPEAGAAGRARARRIDPVEAFEDPLQVPLGDADALVGHAQLGVAFGGPLGADDHAGPLRAVGDRVLQQVAQRGDQQVLVAEDGQAAAAERGERDAARVRLHPAAVEGLGDYRVQVYRARVGHGFDGLDPGQRDEVLDQVGQPLRLLPHLAREPAHRLGVVGGVLDRLGQQRQRAHRRLELVAGVGDEVPLDLVRPGGFPSGPRRARAPARRRRRRRRAAPPGPRSWSSGRRTWAPGPRTRLP